MNRIFALAAAAALVAAPAAAQSVSIPLTGKSSAQVQAEITKAAKKVCTRAIVGATFPQQMYDSCFKAAVADANAKLNSQMAANGRLASK